MSRGGTALSSTTNAPTTELNLRDPTEDKLFKKFILRRTIEDSAHEESKEFTFNKGSHKRIASGSKIKGPPLKKKPSWLDIYNQSPRRESESSAFLTLPKGGSGPANPIRKDSRVLGKSIIYGDKMAKNQIKNAHPLTLFVETTHLE